MKLILLYNNCLIFGLIFFIKTNLACDTSQFNNFKLTWFSGPIGEGNEAYAQNGLEDFKRAFKIKIENETIRLLCPNSVRNMEDLYTLILNETETEEINPGTFDNVPSLRELQITNNKLGIIESDVFTNLNITILNLSNNQISTIESNAFDNMTQLRMIYLQNNKIRYINNEWFKNCNNLVTLNFENNDITSIPANAFQNLIGKHKYVFYELYTSVILSYNKIKYIDPHAFDGLDGLGEIHLNNNKIKSLNQNIFKGLKYLKLVDLNNNLLKCLPEDKSNILMADITYLEDNPWDCDCLIDIKSYKIKNNKNLQMQYAMMTCQMNDIKKTIEDIKIKLDVKDKKRA